jgi:hypothetical protein
MTYEEILDYIKRFFENFSYESTKNSCGVCNKSVHYDSIKWIDKRDREGDAIYQFLWDERERLENKRPNYCSVECLAQYTYEHQIEWLEYIVR